MTINEFEDEENFYVLPRVSYYDATMTIFGWGGKSKCFRYLVYNVAVYKIFVWLVLIVRLRKYNVSKYYRAVEQDNVRLY